MSCTLITGAAGFLGQAVVRQFQAENLPLRTTDRQAPGGVALPDFHPFNLVEDDDYSGLLRGVQCVVHLAGWVHRFHRERAERDLFFRVNVGATEKLLQAALAAGAGHFVLASTVAIYGPPTGIPRTETDPCRPQTAYAQSKWEAECLVRELCGRAGIRATILRPATLYGEGDPGNVARLIAAVDRGRFVWIGSGANRKSLLHRDDAARGVLLAGRRSGGEPVEVYHLSGASPTMREIVGEIAASLHKKPPSWRIPARPVLGLSALLARCTGGSGRLGALHQTVRKWLADDVYDGEKLRHAVGFEPRVSLPEGLRREVQWYRSVKNGSLQ
jgi:nucleoside-diphosphate-sugar epimerase